MGTHSTGLEDCRHNPYLQGDSNLAKGARWPTTFTKTIFLGG